MVCDAVTGPPPPARRPGAGAGRAGAGFARRLSRTDLLVDSRRRTRRVRAGERPDSPIALPLAPTERGAPWAHPERGSGAERRSGCPSVRL